MMQITAVIPRNSFALKAVKSNKCAECGSPQYLLSTNSFPTFHYAPPTRGNHKHFRCGSTTRTTRRNSKNSAAATGSQHWANRANARLPGSQQNPMEQGNWCTAAPIPPPPLHHQPQDGTQLRKRIKTKGREGGVMSVYISAAPGILPHCHGPWPPPLSRKEKPACPGHK